MKWSGAWAPLNSGSAGERQRSGSGPRYSISLIATGLRRNAGTSGERPSAASRLIMRWPSFPHPNEGGTESNGNNARVATRRRKIVDEFIPGEYTGSRQILGKMPYLQLWQRPVGLCRVAGN